MTNLELRKFIRETILQYKKEDNKEDNKPKKEQEEDLSILDQMFDDPNIRYETSNSTLIGIAKHPKFGNMPIYNETIKVDRDIQKNGLQK